MAWMQVSYLRDHAAGNRAVLDQRLGLRHRELGDQLAVLVEHARHIGEKQQASRLHRAGDGARECVGVDVVGMAVPARRNRGDHRDHLGTGQQVQQRAVHLDRLAHETEVEHTLDIGIRVDNRLAGAFGEYHVAVLAAEPDRPFALGIDERDDLLVDRTGQHHLDDLDGSRIRHAQSALETGLDAEALQHVGNLRPAAVHHDRVDAGLLQQRDVAGKGASEFLVAHGVPAVLHHDGLVLVTLHERQRGREKGGLCFCVSKIRHVPFPRMIACLAGARKEPLGSRCQHETLAPPVRKRFAL